MKNRMYMTLKNVIEKRLERKKMQLNDIESVMSIGDNATVNEKRKFIETKAVIQELENVLDIAVSIFEQEQDNENT